MPSLILDPDSLCIIQDIFRKLLPHGTVRAFGSRVSGSPKPFSDLDLCIMHPTIEPMVMDALRTALSESLIPMKVDILQWSELSPSFKEIIEQTSIPFTF